MGLKTKSMAAVAALSLMAAPAVAQDTPRGQQTSPAKLCADKSKKRTAAQKQAGQKSEFAQCVSGAAKAQAEARRNARKPESQQTRTSPREMCDGKARRRTASQKQLGTQSDFAACVSGAARAQNDAQQS